jgi:hypothetical protein
VASRAVSEKASPRVTTRNQVSPVNTS